MAEKEKENKESRSGGGQGGRKSDDEKSSGGRQGSGKESGNFGLRIADFEIANSFPGLCGLT